MTKRLVIHIGTRKTGTTSIQETLGTSSEILKEYGLYYPNFQPYNHIYNFLPIFTENPEKSKIFILRKLTKEQIEIEIQKYIDVWTKEFENFTEQCFIISAEDLAFLNNNGINRIKEFVLKYFDEIKIVVYVRHLSTLIPSWIQQMTKLGLPSLTQEEILYYFDKNSEFMYTNSVKNWISIFGQENVIIRPFDKKAFKRGDLIDDFLEIIGFGHIDTNKITKTVMNESLGEYAVTFLTELNHKYPVIVDGKLNEERGLASRGIPIDIYSKIDDRRFKLDIKFEKSEAELLNNEIDYINQFLPIEHQFEYVQPSNQKTVIPKVQDIPVSFYVDLINEYHKKIDKHTKANEFYEYLIELVGTDKNIYIWGAGSGGLVVLNMVKKLNLNLVGFIDSDPNKGSSLFEGYPVCSPEFLLTEYKKEKDFILVGSTYYKEIANSLNEMGYVEKEDYLIKIF